MGPSSRTRRSPTGFFGIVQESDPCAARPGEYYLYFLDYHQPGEYTFDLPENAQFQADWIDPWKMTITKIEGLQRGKALVNLPGLPYTAVRFRRV